MGQSRAPFPIVKDDDFLHFQVNGYGTEAENLDEPDEDNEKRKEAYAEIARRLVEGETYSTIQRETGASPRTIAKISKNLKKLEEWWRTGTILYRRYSTGIVLYIHYTFFRYSALKTTITYNP